MGGAYLANQQVGADAEGIGISGSVGTAAARDEAIALASNSLLNTGVNAGNNSTINYTDGGVYDFAKGLVENYNASLSDLVENQSASTSGLLSGLADKISALVESRNTDGESTRNQTILYIALAIAGVFALFFWTRRTR